AHPCGRDGRPCIAPRTALPQKNQLPSYGSESHAERYGWWTCTLRKSRQVCDWRLGGPDVEYDRPWGQQILGTGGLGSTTRHRKLELGGCRIGRTARRIVGRHRTSLRNGGWRRELDPPLVLAGSHLWSLVLG